MKREVKVTSDGSKTLFINELNEGYHSHHGALQEAKHVFIDNGLKLVNDYEINILELGFGTGLNVLVTIDEFLKTDKNHKINFYTLEKYPITEAEIKELGYSDLFSNSELQEIYLKIHESDWEVPVEILPNFSLQKIQVDFHALPSVEIPKINLVYYDCFGARVQPDLWEESLFASVAEKMSEGGLLTTYSSKGSVRRILKALDFEVEKKAGPPGKREMLIAWKNSLTKK